MGDFGDQQWRGETGEARAETDEKSSGSEHMYVDTETLYDTGDHNDSASDEDCPFSAAIVAEVGAEYQTNDCTDTLNGVEQTLLGTMRSVEVWVRELATK
jgi:hypothetical protein